jgi:hypothetical protein
MTMVLAVDANNDLYVGANGSLATATGVQAVLQAAQQAAQTQLGEMVFAVDEGIPNFETVWVGAPNLAQFEAFLRRTLLAVPDVTGVESVEIARQNGVLSYVARIQTTFGAGVVNG